MNAMLVMLLDKQVTFKLYDIRRMIVNRKLYIRTRNQEDLEYIKSSQVFDIIKTKIGVDHQQREVKNWKHMPEFQQIKQEPYALSIVNTTECTEVLSNTLKQGITDKTKSIWYPKLIKRDRGYWYSRSRVANRHPIYIISKGRPKCITARSLSKMGVVYKIVIEPQELDSYRQYHNDDTLITTDFSNLDQGSIPVRNFIWNLSIRNGHTHHWCLDDNIEDFNILSNNTKDHCRTGSIFRYAEDFVGCYSNIGQAGFNYYSFAKSNDSVPPLYLNTRVYSCMLIDNTIPFRWRGRYNEDTDLSLRILKSGRCTVLFNMFLAGKVTTQRMKGGNTDHVYTDGDDRLKFAESLRDQHPDIVRVVRKFNRWHHQVNYSGFKQELNRISEMPCNYKSDLIWKKQEDRYNG